MLWTCNAALTENQQEILTLTHRIRPLARRVIDGTTYPVEQSVSVSFGLHANMEADKMSMVSIDHRRRCYLVANFHFLVYFLFFFVWESTVFRLASQVDSPVLFFLRYISLESEYSCIIKRGESDPMDAKGTTYWGWAPIGTVSKEKVERVEKEREGQSRRKRQERRSDFTGQTGIWNYPSVSFRVFAHPLCTFCDKKQYCNVLLALFIHLDGCTAVLGK